MTNLSRFINNIDDSIVSKKEVDIVMNKLCNEPIVLTVGRQERKVVAANLKRDNQTFANESSADKKAMIEAEIDDLATSTDTDTPYTTTKNYGNLWTYLLTKSNSAVFAVNPATEDEKFNTQLEDYLISPKISYYDEKDAFSTKREVIRSYERIIYATNIATSDINFSIDIFKNINDGLYDVTTPDEYIQLSVPLRYTYLHLLENNYTIFNDERDILLRSVFNNTINYVSENELYALTEKMAKLIIQRAKEEHDDYIQSLEEALRKAFEEAGSDLIDFAKLFNDVSGDYIGQLGNVSGRIIELTKKLYQNYNFDISSEKVNISRIFKDILDEALNVLIAEGIQNVNSIEDLRNFEYVYLLMDFFDFNTNIFTNLIVSIVQLHFNTILTEARKMRNKEGKFLKCFLESSDKDKYTYTEEFIHLYNALKN